MMYINILVQSLFGMFLAICCGIVYVNYDTLVSFIAIIYLEVLQLFQFLQLLVGPDDHMLFCLSLKS